jgi:spermidine synthase
MKPFIYTEMMVHVPLCTHKNPKNILVIADDATALSEELARYKDCNVKIIDAGNAIESIREESENSFDVIISETSEDIALLAHIARVSTDDGLCVVTHPNLDDVKSNSELMRALGKDFKIIMPYHAGEKTLLLASKEYHPTADIILQRSDLLEGQNYYNCDVHIGSFAMGNYIRKNYLGIIKN